jgi:chromosome segregation ATPase
MPRGITEKDVFIACDALLLAGERPTIERVRQKIGRGSPNTVSPMLDAWFKGLGRRLQDPGAFAPAPDVPDPVIQAAQHFWEVAQAESRCDVDARVSAGVADAEARVDEATRRVALAESAAASSLARVETLEGEVARSRTALDAERLNHRGTATQLEGTTARCESLQAQIAQLREIVAEERARADQAIAAANERSDGAERRAAMEIEGERMARARAEKLTESTAKKLEAALREQISATEQVNAAEDRITSFRVQANQREQELQGTLKRRDTQLHELQTELAHAQSALARATGQHVLVEQIIAKLTANSERVAAPVDARSTRAPRKKGESA